MTLEELESIEAIRRLKARYFRLADTQQWEAWREVFTPDAEISIDREVAAPGRPAMQQVFDGRDAFVDYVSARLSEGMSVHHGHMPEIDLLSSTEARGIWAMEDIVVRPGVNTHGHGHYHETYRRDDGEWRIATMRLTRLRRIVHPPES
jgi:hypothetical protein